jgi:2'-5' RNA ligase
MPRLFVALDLPLEIQADLRRVYLPAEPGIRRTPTEQVHLTLHFLGEADIGTTATALAAVTAPACSLTCAGVGQFRSGQRGVILWAGVKPSQELQLLQTEIGLALLPLGYQPERRAFTPHLTLARCQPHVPADIIADFLRQNANWSTPTVPLTEFSLYSSLLTPDGPHYHREARFPLGK